MGYYQSGDYYAAGDPGFFDFLGGVAKGIVGVAGSVAPIVGAIAAPFTGGASLALGGAIGAGARLLGGALSAADQTDPTAAGSAPGSMFSFGGMNLGQLIDAAKSPFGQQLIGNLGQVSPMGMDPTVNLAGASRMSTRAPQFGQDYSDPSYYDDDED